MDGTYTHFRCEITGRLVDSALIDDRGRFRYEDLRTVEYVGDARRRIYRYFSDRVERFRHFRALLQGVSAPLATPAQQRRPGIHTRGPRPRR